MASAVSKKRIDALLVDKKLASSISEARAFLMSGLVYADGKRVEKAGDLVPLCAGIEVRRQYRFSSRAGEKLEGALDSFGINVEGRICVDVGASTGGFTDCLLKRGAAKIYAIDVGRGLLDWRLRNNTQVVVMEGVNIRSVEMLPDKPSFACVDVSFISLKLVLPIVDKIIAKCADVVVLVKPQFEAAKEDVKRGGVVAADVRLRVIKAIENFCEGLGWKKLDGMDSSLPGAKSGNVEYLMWFKKD